MSNKFFLVFASGNSTAIYEFLQMNVHLCNEKLTHRKYVLVSIFVYCG